ncbi:ENTH-domain-containing protein [Sodiomyces alkalinus F11]|uniref:ENTH-domain-containing protein n=1 Tax=Sodiomyces alkalinus (strain CBS 110278 / VKM F-3762 / F11) TaxID=1314773 RepID=A0A3N2Q9F5_SODAK|nr:ENTH-domain-containing protein [Sodiomyces alkalinus F11]ROT43337.1 ENTH-domain-containing protein [Sodiomyces alkalinus F11]
MSKVIRSVKNVTKGYSSVQVKVREATSNDPWGPTGAQMTEIAQLTYASSNEFYEIMDMLDKRMNDKGKNWRHVLKALKVLDYCLHDGSELVVTWARESIYVIKTLREFQYIDDDGRDVGQNVRVAAKELTSLILDEERLRNERRDRKTWKSRVTGLEEYAPQSQGPPQRPARERRRPSIDEEDAEYRLAIEASKHQEEEDRKRREGRPADDVEDDDLAKAIKLSKEEEERRRRELEGNNAFSVFDDTPSQPADPPQVQYTGFNQGYQQGSAVDFFANPIDQSQPAQAQPTGYMQASYTGFPSLPQQGQEQQMAMGFANGYPGYSMQPQMNMGPFGQQQQQQQQQQLQVTGMQGFHPQPTGYNIYQQQQSPSPQDSFQQAGSNNPWASNSSQQPQSPMQPMVTGSNNPFASSIGRPQTHKAPSMPSLGTLPEQKTLSTFNQVNSSGSFGSGRKDLNEHEVRLNALLSSGDGMDTFGNTGQLRIPAQHTAPGTFVNSAGSGAQRLTVDATGNNPFLRTQFTGMPTVSYGHGQVQSAATGMPGSMNGQGNNNPFAANRPQPQNNQNQDLIQF